MRGNRTAGGNRTILVLVLASFALGCSQQFIMGIPSAIASSCDVTLVEVGQLMTAFSIASGLGSPFLLAFTSRTAQRNQLVAGLVMLTVGMTVLGTSSNYGLFLAARVVMGLGSGLFYASAMALATKLADPGKEASALANMGLGSSAAQIVAMPLAQRLSLHVDWHVFYLVLAAYVALSCVVILRRIPATPPDHGMDLSVRARFSPLRDKYIVLALAVMVLLNVGYSSYYTYVTPFLENIFGDGSATVSAVLLVSAFMSAVGIKGAGWLTDRVGYRITCPAALVFQIVTLAALSLFSGNPAAIWVFMCLWVMADWGFNPSQNLLITKLARENAPMALALSSSSLQLGNALGSAAGGAFILVAPISSLPLFSSACVVATLALELVLLKRIGKSRAPRAEVL